MVKASALADLGEFDFGLQYFDKVLEIDPFHVKSLYNKALIFGNQSRRNEEIEIYDKNSEINPNFLDVLYIKGLSLNQLGNYESAIEIFDKLL